VTSVTGAGVTLASSERSGSSAHVAAAVNAVATAIPRSAQPAARGRRSSRPTHVLSAPGESRSPGSTGDGATAESLGLTTEELPEVGVWASDLQRRRRLAPAVRCAAQALLAIATVALVGLIVFVLPGQLATARQDNSEPSQRRDQRVRRLNWPGLIPSGLPLAQVRPIRDEIERLVDELVWLDESLTVP
jgi:hypothetical protein